VNLRTGYWRCGRRVVLGAALAALLAGCGDQAKTVTVDASAPALTAAPSTTAAVNPVRWPVTARVRRSVLPVFCSDPVTAAKDFVGTGFRVSDGVVTASHVAAGCPSGTTFSFGSGDGGTVATDPTHDLALLSYAEYWNPGTDPKPTPLRLETRPAYVGEPLALFGIPAFPLLGNPFKRQVTVVIGRVVATNRTQVLTAAEGQGAGETLRGAILVAVPGVVKGESGGPAVDSAGKVVGVIEGSAPGIATLTPATALTSLH
jgi:S1-C subfamily serine protease